MKTERGGPDERNLYDQHPFSYSQARSRVLHGPAAGAVPGCKKGPADSPDFTRCYSYAGELTQILYKKLAPRVLVHIMPALGTHMAMDEEEKQKMFGSEIPPEAFLDHHWQTDTVSIGIVPREVIEKFPRVSILQKLKWR